ncbi:hypothetical protein ACNKHL_24895 [Shigella flexneri]
MLGSFILARSGADGGVSQKEVVSGRLLPEVGFLALFLSLR